MRKINLINKISLFVISGGVLLSTMFGLGSANADDTKTQVTEIKPTQSCINDIKNQVKNKLSEKDTNDAIEMMCHMKVTTQTKTIKNINNNIHPTSETYGKGDRCSIYGCWLWDAHFNQVFSWDGSEAWFEGNLDYHDCHVTGGGIYDVREKDCYNANNHVPYGGGQYLLMINNGSVSVIYKGTPLTQNFHTEWHDYGDGYESIHG